MRIAYLFSRYPVISQTFCDTEILALESMGIELEIYSIHPPPTSFRHGHAARIRAEIHYAPPSSILKIGERLAKESGRWPEKLIGEHDKRYGTEYKAGLRARNALYFADLFQARNITHFHVHFANRAAHTAIFVKAIAGLPFSVSTHGQDFMSDLGNNDLLREICREAEFIANETEFSKGLIANLCPDSRPKMLRVFNGMNLENFTPSPSRASDSVRLLSVGRLIEFKGFQHLIPACEGLKRRRYPFSCEIIGEGPWREQLQAEIQARGLAEVVHLPGALPQEIVFEKLLESDIFVLPCVVDANGASDVFPTVILEAMATGKPVVSTRLAGVPEQIIDGETGFLVEPGDEAGLEAALAKLINSPDLRRNFGEAGRRRIESEFTVEHTVLPLKQNFEKCVSAAPRPKSDASGFACLLYEWPAGERVEAELKQLVEANPNMRIYVAHATNVPPPESTRTVLRHLVFLPDAMVLEAEWLQKRTEARQMETWRVDLGQRLPTETFLQMARYALYVRQWLVRDGVRHLHSLTSREFLWGWLLRKLSGVTLSATLDEKSASLPESVALKLAEQSAGLRIHGERLFEELSASPQSRHRVMLRQKHGRSLESQWLTNLNSWGQGQTTVHR